VIGEEIRALMPPLTTGGERGGVLIAGLGNSDVTPDAIGPETVKRVTVTRHLEHSYPKVFQALGNHAVAAIHAGWRGTLARIVDKTIREMAFAYKTEPKDLKVVIGPGISLDNFEVGDEVYEAFEQEAFPMDKIADQRPNAAFHADAAERNRLAAEGNIEQPLKWHINLPLSNKLILLNLGVKDENILMSDICTYAHSDEYFSARKLEVDSGRIYTAIMLR